MKHPALVRVFAIVLIIMCTVTLAAGGVGMLSCFKDKSQQDGELQLMKDRTDSAEKLEKVLGDSQSYDEQSAELVADKELHDEGASQHRTDLATYSATKGGTKMGANQLWDAKAGVDGAKAQLEAGQEQINKSKTQLAGIQGLAASCSSCSTEVSAAIAILTAAPAAAQAASQQVIDNAVQAGIAAYLQANPGATETELAAAGQQAAAAAAADAQLAAAGVMQAAQTNASAAMPGAAEYNTVKNDGAATLAGLAAAAGTAFDPSPFAADIDVSIDLTDMQGTITRLYTAKGILDGLSSGLSSAATAMQARLDAAQAELNAGKAKLETGEQTIQSNLELIWWQNGELEKDAAELEEKRDQLDAESKALAAREAAAEERKENESRYRSLSMLLKKNDNINSAVSSGGDLIESARTEIVRLSAGNRRVFGFRLGICSLSLLAGVLGFFVLPAAFESSKSRAMLLVPAIISSLCAAAALGLSLYIGRGVLYSALFLMIFAIVYLLSAIPRKT